MRHLGVPGISFEGFVKLVRQQHTCIDTSDNETSATVMNNHWMPQVSRDWGDAASTLGVPIPSTLPP